jgi:hypothetical protein
VAGNPTIFAILRIIGGGCARLLFFHFLKSR